MIPPISPDPNTPPNILQFNAFNQLSDPAALSEMLHHMTITNSHFALLQEQGNFLRNPIPSQWRLHISGRVAIIHLSQYHVNIIPDGTTTSDEFDSLEIEVHLPNKTIFNLCSVYRPPTVNARHTTSKPLLTYIARHLSNPSNIILGGDMNIHSTHLGSNTNFPATASRRLWDFIETMESGGCLNNGSPTRIGPPAAIHTQTPSAIDITLWNTIDPANFLPTTWTPGTQLRSDHRTILIGAPFLARQDTLRPSTSPSERTLAYPTDPSPTPNKHLNPCHLSSTTKSPSLTSTSKQTTSAN